MALCMSSICVSLLLLLLSTPLHQRAASRVQHPKSCGSQQSLPPVARKGSTLSEFVQRSRLEREVGRDLHSNKWEECDRASGRVGKVVRDVMDLQWKRDMRQGVCVSSFCISLIVLAMTILLVHRFHLAASCNRTSAVSNDLRPIYSLVSVASFGILRQFLVCGVVAHCVITFLRACGKD